MLKMRTKRAKICHFYAQIVKFGLILIYLKLFGGKKIFLGEDAPHAPCGATTAEKHKWVHNSPSTLHRRECKI